MKKMQLLKVISELSFAIGRLEGMHKGLEITNQKIQGMELLLKVASDIRSNVDILDNWFKEDFCKEK
jgi:hypothetical protein